MTCVQSHDGCAIVYFTLAKHTFALQLTLAANVRTINGYAVVDTDTQRNRPNRVFLAATTLTYPLDLMRARLAMHKHSGLVEGIRQTYSLGMHLIQGPDALLSPPFPCGLTPNLGAGGTMFVLVRHTSVRHNNTDTHMTLIRPTPELLA